MSDQAERHELNGRDRQIIGRLHYPEPPADGALLGPNAWGETTVVLGTVDGTTLVGRAIVDDISRVGSRLDDPQTLAEFRTRVLSQQVPAIFRGRP